TEPPHKRVLRSVLVVEIAGGDGGGRGLSGSHSSQLQRLAAAVASGRGARPRASGRLRLGFPPIARFVVRRRDAEVELHAPDALEDSLLQDAAAGQDVAD